MKRKHNFSAGPSVLPVEVLEELQKNIVDYEENGYSLIEASHRGNVYEAVHDKAIELVKELMGVPEGYSIIFIGGGATMQFGMIPMNFMLADKQACYVDSGAWAKKAVEDAQKIGKTEVVFSGKEKNYTCLPEEVKLSKNAAYLHITSNETIGGVQWKEWPDTGDVPLIVDMSSDILSRPVPVERFACIYAGVQKNMGPAGATLVIIRDDLLARCPDTLPAYLNYKTHTETKALYNTPPVFSIWGVKLVLEWVRREGGAAAMERRAGKKASILYSVIDESGGFFRCPVETEVRSHMNVVFRLPNEDLESKFINQAKNEGMLGLKGHRSVGGCRASIYNAMPQESVEELGAFMKDFMRVHG